MLLIDFVATLCLTRSIFSYILAYWWHHCLARFKLSCVCKYPMLKSKPNFKVSHNKNFTAIQIVLQATWKNKPLTAILLATKHTLLKVGELEIGGLLQFTLLYFLLLPHLRDHHESGTRHLEYTYVLIKVLRQ